MPDTSGDAEVTGLPVLRLQQQDAGQHLHSLLPSDMSSMSEGVPIIAGFHGTLTVDGVKVADVTGLSFHVQTFHRHAFTFVYPPIPPETIRYWDWVDAWNDCQWL